VSDTEDRATLLVSPPASGISDTGIFWLPIFFCRRTRYKIHTTHMRITPPRTPPTIPPITADDNPPVPEFILAATSTEDVNAAVLVAKVINDHLFGLTCRRYDLCTVRRAVKSKAKYLYICWRKTDCIHSRFKLQPSQQYPRSPCRAVSPPMPAGTVISESEYINLIQRRATPLYGRITLKFHRSPIAPNTPIPPCILKSMVCIHSEDIDMTQCRRYRSRSCCKPTPQ